MKNTFSALILNFATSVDKTNFENLSAIFVK